MLPPSRLQYESHLLHKVIPYVYPEMMSDKDRLEADASFSLPLHSDAMIEVVRRFLKGDFPSRRRPITSHPSFPFELDALAASPVPDETLLVGSALEGLALSESIGTADETEDAGESDASRFTGASNPHDEAQADADVEAEAEAVPERSTAAAAAAASAAAAAAAIRKASHDYDESAVSDAAEADEEGEGEAPSDPLTERLRIKGRQMANRARREMKTRASESKEHPDQDEAELEREEERPVRSAAVGPAQGGAGFAAFVGSIMQRLRGMSES
jgi:hypothetical protein